MPLKLDKISKAPLKVLVFEFVQVFHLQKKVMVFFLLNTFVPSHLQQYCSPIITGFEK